MIKLIYSNLLNIVKNKIFIITTFIYYLFFILLFIQKGYNTNSGYYQPDLLRTNYLVTFNYCILSLMGMVYASVSGGILGGQDYNYNTIINIVIKRGRIYSIIAQFISFIIIMILFTSTIFILSIIEYGLFNRQILSVTSNGLATKFLFTILVNVQKGTVAFVAALLIKNSNKGILFVLVGWITTMQFSSYLPIISKLKEIINNAVAGVFNDVTTMKDYQIGFSAIKSESNVLLGLIVIISITIVIIGISLIFCNHREYKA